MKGSKSAGCNSWLLKTVFAFCQQQLYYTRSYLSHQQVETMAILCWIVTVLSMTIISATTGKKMGYKSLCDAGFCTYIRILLLISCFKICTKMTSYLKKKIKNDYLKIYVMYIQQIYVNHRTKNSFHLFNFISMGLFNHITSTFIASDINKQMCY